MITIPPVSLLIALHAGIRMVPFSEPNLGLLRLSGNADVTDVRSGPQEGGGCGARAGGDFEPPFPNLFAALQPCLL